jgi:hypothetical protein
VLPQGRQQIPAGGRRSNLGGDDNGNFWDRSVVLELVTRSPGLALREPRPDSINKRQLISGLSTPVTITVEPYEVDRADCALDGADALFIAGGPIFDAPRILAKHWTSVLAMRLHAAIFWIGKLTELFYDSGRSNWSRTIGALETAWLIEKMDGGL